MDLERPSTRADVHMLRAIDRNARPACSRSYRGPADRSRAAASDLRVDFRRRRRRHLRTRAAEAVDAMASAAREARIRSGGRPPGPVIVHVDPPRSTSCSTTALQRGEVHAANGRCACGAPPPAAPTRGSGSDDAGQGIPKGRRARLFERFYRLASTTDTRHPGHGAGSAIANVGGRSPQRDDRASSTPPEWSTTLPVPPALDATTARTTSGLTPPATLDLVDRRCGSGATAQLTQPDPPPTRPTRPPKIALRTGSVPLGRLGGEWPRCALSRSSPPCPAASAGSAPAGAGTARRRPRWCRSPRPRTARAWSGRPAAAEAPAQRVEDGPVDLVQPQPSTPNSSSPSRAASPVTTPSPRTSTKSRTRRKRRLAIRGVPRDVRRSAAAPSARPCTPESRPSARRSACSSTGS